MMSTESFFTNIAFSYNIKIFKNSPIYKNEKFLNALEKKSELLITSKVFFDGDACQLSLDKNFKILSDFHLDGNNINFASIGAYNPASPANTKSLVIDDGIPWDKRTIFRIYLINADQYARGVLNIYMLGQLGMRFDYTDQESV